MYPANIQNTFVMENSENRTKLNTPVRISTQDIRSRNLRVNTIQVKRTNDFKETEIYDLKPEKLKIMKERIRLVHKIRNSILCTTHI